MGPMVIRADKTGWRAGGLCCHSFGEEREVAWELCGLVLSLAYQEMFCTNYTSGVFHAMRPQTMEGTKVPWFVCNWRVRIWHRNHRDRSIGLSSWPSQKGCLSVRLTYLSQNQLGWERPLRSSPNNNPTRLSTRPVLESITVLHISFLSDIR